MWEIKSLESVLLFKGDLFEGIGAVALSGSGKYLAAVSTEFDQNIVVYDVQKAK